MGFVRIVSNLGMKVSRVGILVGGDSLGLGIEEMPIQEYSLDVMVCEEIYE